MTPGEHGSARDTTIGALTVTLTLVGWTVTPLFIKYFTDHVDAWTSNGWRYGFAALIWSPLLVAGSIRKTLPPGLFRAALVPAFINASAQVCFTWAHYKIEPGLLTFGLRSQMIFVALGAAILFPVERRVIRSGAFLGGMVLVMVGTVGAIGGGQGFGDREYGLGVVLALAAGAGFAGYALAVRKYMHDIPSLIAFAAISLYTAIAMIGMMLVFGKDAGAGALELEASIFVFLLVSAVIGIAAGHVLYYMAIRRLGVAVSTGVIQLQPVCVSVLSYFAFNEVLTALQWGSGGLAIVGALLMLWIQHRTMSRIRAEQAAARKSERESEAGACDGLLADHVAASVQVEGDAAPDAQ